MHDALVTDNREHATTRGEVTALGERDETLGVRAKTLGLGLGGGNAPVLEQRRGQVRQNQALVSRATAKTRSLGGRRHESCSFVV